MQLHAVDAGLIVGGIFLLGYVMGRYSEHRRANKLIAQLNADRLALMGRIVQPAFASLGRALNRTGTTIAEAQEVAALGNRGGLRVVPRSG